jgi:predicted AlkP superfamily pyrophosphatase or phosphodiesterase
VDAEQVLLLVLDGMGWEQLQDRPHLAPTMTAMAGGPMTSVVPSTTATALTSLTTGMPPAVHGIVGYRVLVPSGEVLNVLRWTTASGDARESTPPETLQPFDVFLGTKPPVVTRAEFADSGFTRAHLAGSPLFGWRYASTLVARTRAVVAEGHDLVYAYYAGVDTVAHEFGFGDLYDAEVAAADRLVADLLGVLPPGAALLVVADHGEVFVGDAVVPLGSDVAELAAVTSGEGRFRWLHARDGLVEPLLDATRDQHGSHAWVCTRDEVVADGWFGGELRPEVAARLGDVALVAHAPIAFDDPTDTGGYRLQCRHGSLTPAEMLVPLLGARA